MHRVPIRVAVPHVPKRRRETSTAFFLDHADIEIREFASVDASVVAEGRLGTGEPSRWLSEGGSLWRPVLDAGPFVRDRRVAEPSFSPLRDVLTVRPQPSACCSDDPFGAFLLVLGADPSHPVHHISCRKPGPSGPKGRRPRNRAPNDRVIGF